MDGRASQCQQLTGWSRHIEELDAFTTMSYEWQIGFYGIGIHPFPKFVVSPSDADAQKWQMFVPQLISRFKHIPFLLLVVIEPLRGPLASS